MKASSQYPAEKMRDREWARTMGHTPSLMDYSRFNYVAQPEDGFDPEILIPGVGPYDKWAISWGYKPITSAHSPDDEKRTLDEWAREQEKYPYLRFADDAAVDKGYDPGEETEAVGDADAVKSTALGLKNLERVSKMLLSASSTQPGEPYDDLRALNKRMLVQWATEMGHVVRIVGGVFTNNRHVGQEGTVYDPVPSGRQREAVKFLNENAFTAPRFLLNPEIINRIDPDGVSVQVGDLQSKLLLSLLSPVRLERLQNLQSVNGMNGYGPLDLLSDVHGGVWKELRGKEAIKIDTLRRNIQRAYVEHLGKQMQSSKAVNVRPFLRGDLVSLRAEIKSALPRVGEPATRAHLKDIQDQISQILDPKVPVPVVPPSKSVQTFSTDQSGDFFSPPICWPEGE